MQVTGGLITTVLLFESFPYPSAIIFILSDRAVAITAFFCVTIYSYGEGTYIRNCQATKEEMEQN